MAVTLAEIAALAGVSRGTVDRALNDRGRVDPKVAARVRRIAAERGYRPNRAGRMLARAKNPIRIGVIVQSVETMFMHTVFCLLYTSPSPRDATLSRMPSSA